MLNIGYAARDQTARDINWHNALWKMCNNTTQLKAGKAAKGCVLGVGADTGDAVSFAVGQAT